MGLPTLTQDERLELCFFARVYLVHWELPSSKTLYLSDRNFRYDYGSVQHYENYLFDLSSLPVELERIRANRNHKITLRFRNEKILDVDHLIELNDTYRFCFSTLKIYELRLVEPNETFASDVKQLIFRGVCGQPYEITRREFQVDCHNVLLAKRDRLPLKVMDTDTFPNADPDDLGKFRNSIYGTVGNSPCKCVKAGAKDLLAEDLDSSETTIEVSGDSKIDFPGSGTIQIDSEQISYTGFSSNQFTGCTRGANSTEATAHDKGAAVFEVLSEYIYEWAKHPVKAIDAVKVDGIRQTADFTAYTGKSGDELTGYEGTAVIKFTVKPVIRKQVNLEHTDGVDETIGINHDDPVNDGLGVYDNISFTSSATTKETYPNSYEQYNTQLPTNGYNGNENDYCQVGHASLTSWIRYYFPSTSYGTIIKQYLWILIRDLTGTIDIYGGWSPSSISGTYTEKAWIRFEKSGGNWQDYVYIYAQAGEYIKIWETKKVVEYTPTLSKSGSAYRSGSITGAGSASKTGTVSGTGTLSGNSSADTVIGELVTVDGEGYEDDASGTYTGTPNALIERPDHVFKHILVALLGESAADIGDSFAASGSSYGSTYKLAFILHEVAQQADDLLQKLAFQSRSEFLEWRGKFELIYLGSAPEPARTFADDELLEEPVFGYTPEIDIRNRIYAHYKRDYRKGGGFEAYDGVETDSDSTSITKNGERVERVELSACRTQAMAADWVAWFLTQTKQEWRTVEVLVPWTGKLLTAGNTFSLTWDFWSAVTWDLMQADADPSLENIRLVGQEWPS